METLNKLICVHLDVHIISGRRKLRLEDLNNVAPDQVPPDRLASLGSKKIIDPEEIQKFVNIKRKMEREIENRTVAFLGMRAGAAAAVRELIPVLDGKVAEFAALRRSFLDRYEDIQKAWLKANPAWANIIAAGQIPKATVERRLSCRYQVVRIAEVAGDVLDVDGRSINERLEGAVASLGDQLFEEIARIARDAYEESFKGKAAVTRKALRPIRLALAKLESLAFIDSRTQPVIERVRASLEALPRTGVIEGNDLNALLWLVTLMSDSDRLIDFAEAVQRGDTPPQATAQQAAAMGDHKPQADVDQELQKAVGYF